MLRLLPFIVLMACGGTKSSARYDMQRVNDMHLDDDMRVVGFDDMHAPFCDYGQPITYDMVGDAGAYADCFDACAALAPFWSGGSCADGGSTCAFVSDDGGVPTRVTCTQASGTF